jgi:hypothetical protein
MIADVRWLTVAGLVLDVIGVLVLWRYGLPEEVSRSGAIRFIAEQEDAAEKALARHYDRLARLGSRY